VKPTSVEDSVRMSTHQGCFGRRFASVASCMITMVTIGKENSTAKNSVWNGE
jgi:hypothetical protein